jgi:hypothetical protein
VLPSVYQLAPGKPVTRPLKHWPWSFVLADRSLSVWAPTPTGVDARLG